MARVGLTPDATRGFRSWLPYVCLLTLLATVAGAQVRHTHGLLAEGTVWENPYYIIDSGVAGPTLLLTAGLHGNEPAGYWAAEQIRHWPLARGRLIVVPSVQRYFGDSHLLFCGDEGVRLWGIPGRQFPMFLLTRAGAER